MPESQLPTCPHPHFAGRAEFEYESWGYGTNFCVRCGLPSGGEIDYQAALEMDAVKEEIEGWPKADCS
jgi:hypothetical protein